MGIKVIKDKTNKTIRSRYISCQAATPSQIETIKKMLTRLGREERASQSFDSVDYFSADRMIKTLGNEMRKKKIRMKETKRRKKKQSI